MVNFDDVALGTIAKIMGKKCCSQDLGEYRSFHLGFGARIEAPGIHGKRILSEWCIGTYNSAWRVVFNGAIICGSMNPVYTNAELARQLEAIEFGSFVGIEVLSPVEIRLLTSNGVIVEFMCASSDEDAYFHVMGIDHSFLSCSPGGEWKFGSSLVPDHGTSTH